MGFGRAGWMMGKVTGKSPRGTRRPWGRPAGLRPRGRVYQRREETGTEDGLRVRLKPIEQRWVEAYFGEAQGDAREAARLAGYKNPVSAAVVMMNSPRINKLLGSSLMAVGMSAGEALVRLAEIARGDIADVAELVGKEAGEAGPIMERLKGEQKSHLIRKLTPTKHGLAVEVHDKARALELIGKYHGLFRQVVDVTYHDPEVDAEAQASLLQDADSLDLACELDRRVAEARSRQQRIGGRPSTPDSPVVPDAGEDEIPEVEVIIEDTQDVEVIDSEGGGAEESSGSAESGV